MQDANNNVVELLRKAAEATPDRLAIATSGNGSGSARITFSELWKRTDSCGAGLSDLGIGPGDRVLLMVPMSVDLYVTLLAVLKVGAVAVFIDPWIGRRQIARFAAFAEPAAFIGIGKSHLLRLMDSQLRAIRVTVTTGPALFGIPARSSLRQLMTRQGDGVIARVDATDAALVTFTTGSSGKPKGANRTHGYLLAQHAALQAEFPYHDSDVDFTMFPVFALNNLAKGIPTIVPDIDFRRVAEADGGALLAQVTAESATTLTASPPLVDRLRDAIVLASSTSEPKTKLRRILVGGAPVSDAQLRDWQKAFPGVEILVVYGSTEAEPVAHIEVGERLGLTSDRHPDTPGFCTGTPTSLLKTRVVRIVDEPIQLDERGWLDWEVTPGEIGELVVSGEHVGKEYFRSSEATTANKIHETDGTVWHRMGDTGYFDAMGRFWLAGRVHSTIRRRGQLIHPQLVEQAAAGDGVERLAALAMPAENGEQRLVVVVQAQEAARRAACSVAARLRERGIEADEVAVTSAALPLDPRHNSKVDYQRLSQLLDEDNSGLAASRWSMAELTDRSIEGST